MHLTWKDKHVIRLHLRMKAMRTQRRPADFADAFVVFGVCAIFMGFI